MNLLRPNAVLFYDLENVEGSLIAEAIRCAQSHGTLASVNVYGDFRSGHTETFHTLHNLGVITRQVSRGTGRNAADIALTTDAVSMLCRNPDLHVVAIVSGDSDFLPLVQWLRMEGRYVVGMAAERHVVAPAFEQACHTFYRLRAMNEVHKQDGPPLNEVVQTIKDFLTQGPRRLDAIVGALQDKYPGLQLGPLGFKKWSQVLRSMPQWFAIEQQGPICWIRALRNDETQRPLRAAS